MRVTAFERELMALLPRLRRFATGLVQGSVDADDLCQAAVERALNARGQWQPGTRLDSWMYRIMRNIWIDEVRARGRRDAVIGPEEEGVQIGDRGDAAVEARVALGEVDAVMATLPVEQREAVLLVLVEGFGYREAAEILDVPIGTLTSRLARGRAALMARLGEAA